MADPPWILRLAFPNIKQDNDGTESIFMSLSQLFDQFLGGGGNGSQNGNSIQQNVGDKLSGLGDKIPGGALGGLAAGGLLGVLVGNKKVRKTVG
jgi:uncharacterized membrane protein YebE (DUF533 family)